MADVLLCRNQINSGFVICSAAIPVILGPGFQAVNQGAELLSAQADLACAANWDRKLAAFEPFCRHDQPAATPRRILIPMRRLLAKKKRLPESGSPLIPLVVQRRFLLQHSCD